RPARSAMARSSSTRSTRPYASARARPMPTRFNTMKGIGVMRNIHFKSGLLAAFAVLAWSAPAFAQDAAKLDAGNTAWMLTSTVLVLMMTIPGLALFYGGMVRKKNVLATVMQSF